MRNSLRLSIGAVLVAAAAACSGSPDHPTVSSDLEQDLAKAGGTNVQLAGNSGNRVEVVSASERVESPTPAPKAKTVSRAPSVNRGTRAVAPSPKRETPAAAQPAPKAEEQTPAEQPRVERQPEPEPLPQSRPQAPVPSRQPEPRGGWRTPGEVIRNAPFPINP
jgi:outer membrane biosynthesis protein TonB